MPPDHITSYWRYLRNKIQRENISTSKKFVDCCFREKFFFNHGATAPNGPRPPHLRGFMITLGRIPLNQ